MPDKIRIPSYRLHRASGQAVVVLNGQSIYLGKWKTPESLSKYERVIAEWLANGRRQHQVDAASVPGDPETGATSLRVTELIAAFFEHAKNHYRHADGTPTGEVDNFRHALRPLRRLFGDTPARDFGPLRLRAVRDELLNTGLCRTTINSRIHRIRRAFRWAASMELVPASVVQALNTVASLQRGRCSARESSGVQPVDWQLVDATLPHLPRPVAAMVEIMRYSNCRAEDVVMMRGCDLSVKGDIWEYQPARHKNQWREEISPRHKRIVHLGNRCQEILSPFLERPPEAYLFSPRESRAAYQAERAARSTTMRGAGGYKRKRNPRRGPNERYTVNTFQQTVRKACQKLRLPPWTVLQVRHSRATEIRERYGLEGAAASLGNSVEAAQIYAENNRQLAQQIAREVG